MQLTTQTGTLEGNIGTALQLSVFKGDKTHSTEEFNDGFDNVLSCD